MLEAVLFDWGHTLMDWVPSPELLEAGHRAGLEALGRDDLPDVALVSARFREAYLPLLEAALDTVDEVEYPGLVRGCLADVGVRPTTRSSRASSRPSTLPGRRRGAWARTGTRCSTRCVRAS